jgi:hypothetical protein
MAESIAPNASNLLFLNVLLGEPNINAEILTNNQIALLSYRK